MKLTSAERLAVLREIDKLNEQLCNKCRHSDKYAYDCDCKAALRIRILGNILSGETEPDKELTIHVYRKLKRQHYTDKEIADHVGKTKGQLEYFKRKNKLFKPQTVTMHASEINGLTPEKYHEYVAAGSKIRSIREKYGIPETTFLKWRKRQGLYGPRKAEDNINELNKTI